MAAATQNRDGQRQPSELVPYTGASGYNYYKNTLIIRSGVSGGAGVPIPLTLAGSSRGGFLGVAANRVDQTAGLGASQRVLELWKTGEFTFDSQGTGASWHIGLRAYGIDDQTVGISAALPALYVGEIVGMPSTSEYRVRIDNAVGVGGRGVSLDQANF